MKMVIKGQASSHTVKEKCAFIQSPKAMNHMVRNATTGTPTKKKKTAWTQLERVEAVLLHQTSSSSFLRSK